MFKSEGHTTPDTLIGSSVHMEGDFQSEGNVQIEGKVTGSITTTGNLTVGEQAHISASVDATNAFIGGYVKGNVIARERLELAATSKIDGDVMAKIIVMAEGAQLNGRCQMGSPAPTTTKTSSKRTGTEAA